MKVNFENGSSITTIDGETNPVRGKQMKEWISYYRHNPYEWILYAIEDINGVKLYPYQKTILKLMCVKDECCTKEKENQNDSL